MVYSYDAVMPFRSRAILAVITAVVVVALVVVIGGADDAMAACEELLAQGVFAQAIRPPTVAEGTSRLRIAVMSSHTKTELTEAARLIARVAKPFAAAQRIQHARVLASSEPDRSRIYDGLAEAA